MEYEINQTFYIPSKLDAQAFEVLASRKDTNFEKPFNNNTNWRSTDRDYLSHLFASINTLDELNVIKNWFSLRVVLEN